MPDSSLRQLKVLQGVKRKIHIPAEENLSIQQEHREAIDVLPGYEE